MLKIDDLAGLWTRSLQVWADGRRDTSTNVVWLQGQTIFADMRQPPGIESQFGHARCLHELSFADCETLSQQQGFAGVFSKHDDYFQWTRRIDYQPAQGTIDAGRLFWRGDILVEEGLRHEHFEHWHRDPGRPLAPTWGYVLKDAAAGIPGYLLRVGDAFMYARDRNVTLVDGSLSEAVRGAADVAAARALIDFEISFGEVSADQWRITRSTLPYRKDASFKFESPGSNRLATQDIAPDGIMMTRIWEIIKAEGDVATA